MVHKRCYEPPTNCPEGKKAAPRCKHGWYFYGEHTLPSGRKLVFRGPLKKWAGLLKPGQPIPDNKTDADTMDLLIKAWMARGADPAELEPTPPPAGTPPPPTPTTTKTVNTVLDDYHHDHGRKLNDNSYPSIIKAIRAEFGTEDYTRLFDRRAWKDWLGTIEEERSVATRNRYFARWRHLVYWLIAEDSLKIDLPFYHKFSNRTGIKQLHEGPGRKRRLLPGEEAAIIAACERLVDRDGGMMLGRFYCAVDCGLRRGEMLKLRRAAILTDYQGKGLTLHVQWTTSKTATERFVPVHTDRLRAFVKTRRFHDFPFGHLDGARCDRFREDWENVLIEAGLESGQYVPYHRAPGRRWIWDEPGADLTWHDLRHECGSRMADDLTPNHEIQYLLGHQRLETTQKYTNAKFTSLADNMRKHALKRGL